MYDYFEDIVCINLDISIERRKHAEYYFDKLNIPARFYTAKKHCKGGMYGCFESHIEVLKDAYKRNLNNLLVFEDDFLPTATYSNEKLQDAVIFMKNNNGG
jgi:GR25 family glycosyltransferase involved in LPS biosynthesis